MPGGFDDTYFVFVFGTSHLFRRGAGIDQALHHPVLHKRHAMAPNAFAIERSARLQGMHNVVADIDVVAEQFRAHTIVQKGTLIENRQTAEIKKHEADHVEYGGRFQNHRVLPCGNLPRMCRLEPFFCRSLGKRLGIEVGHIRRVGFLPTGGIRRQHSDGNFRRSLCVPLAQAARVENPLDGFRRREDPCCGEFVVGRDTDNFADRVGTLFGRDRGRLLEMPARQRLCGAGALARVRHWQQIRVWLLHLCQRFRCLHDTFQTFVIKFICRRARCPPIKGCAHRHSIIFFRDVLMDGVIGESSQRRCPAIEQNLHFIRSGVFPNAIEDVASPFLV